MARNEPFATEFVLIRLFHLASIERWTQIGEGRVVAVCVTYRLID